jgi:hypothetical protein
VTRPTEPATFRFDKTVLDQLRREAEQKQISLNTLLNQIVKSHTEWHAKAITAGFMPVRKKLITRLFDSLTEEQIGTIASSLSQDLSEGKLMMMVRERTPKAILDFMESWLRISGIDYQRENIGNHLTYVIQHNMGAKWSHYLARLFEETASAFAVVRQDIKAADDALYIKLKMA